jgi:predicted nucleic acid-binding protein
MPYLADTNILLRLMHRSDPEHQLVREAIRTLRRRGERIFYASQNLVEFWRVCTRPISANGFGLSIAETNGRAKVIERLYTLAPELPDVHRQWRALVVIHAVSGIQVHDAKLVALMRVHGLVDLLTLNVADFQRYPGISASHPRIIIAAGP